MVEKPKKKSRRKVSKEGSTEDQPNPGVRFLTDYIEVNLVKFYQKIWKYNKIKSLHGLKKELKDTLVGAEQGTTGQSPSCS